MRAPRAEGIFGPGVSCGRLLSPSVRVHHFSGSFLGRLLIVRVSQSRQAVNHMVLRYAKLFSTLRIPGASQIFCSWLIQTLPIPREWAAKKIFSSAQASSSPAEGTVLLVGRMMTPPAGTYRNRRGLTRQR